LNNEDYSTAILEDGLMYKFGYRESDGIPSMEIYMFDPGNSNPKESIIVPLKILESLLECDPSFFILFLGKKGYEINIDKEENITYYDVFISESLLHFTNF